MSKRTLEQEPAKAERWTWEEAFGRNLGLLSRGEQNRLREATVAIVGAGGVGGGHAITLARQGVGAFRIADGDTFCIANLNRQAGATVTTVGQNKATVIGAMVHAINPEAQVDAWPKNVDATNVDAFLDGAAVVLDGLDAFAIEARRLLFRRAREKGLWVLSAGPLGFSTALLAFSPRGMSFDEYCGFEPGMTRDEQLIAFFLSVAPSGLHRSYMDLSFVNFAARTGPSAALACQLSSAVIAMEALAVILGRRPPLAAPLYTQFDPYRRRLVTRKRWGRGNGLWQRVQRAVAARLLKRLGAISDGNAEQEVS